MKDSCSLTRSPGRISIGLGAGIFERETYGRRGMEVCCMSWKSCRIRGCWLLVLGYLREVWMGGGWIGEGWGCVGVEGFTEGFTR